METPSLPSTLFPGAECLHTHITWVWLVGAAIMPVLWIIIWVRRDRIALARKN